MDFIAGTSRTLNKTALAWFTAAQRWVRRTCCFYQTCSISDFKIWVSKCCWPWNQSAHALPVSYVSFRGRDLVFLLQESSNAPLGDSWQYIVAFRSLPNAVGGIFRGLSHSCTALKISTSVSLPLSIKHLTIHCSWAVSSGQCRVALTEPVLVWGSQPPMPEGKNE